MDSEFKLTLDAYAPLEGVSFRTDKEKLTKILDENVFPRLSGETPLLNEIIRGLTIDEKDRQIRIERINTIRSLVLDSIPNNARIEDGRVSLEIENNPSGHPTLVLSSNGKQISRTEVSNLQQAVVVLDALETVIRAPEIEKGAVGLDTPGGWWDLSQYYHIGNNLAGAREVQKLRTASGGNIGSYYSTRPYLQRLWYNQFGRGSERFDNIVGGLTGVFFVNKVEEYTEPKK